MAALKGAKIDATQSQDPPIPEASKKPAKPRKNKGPRGKEVAQEEPVAGSSNTKDASPWAWKSLTESAASRVPPVFTKDGSYFFSVNGSSVKIYAVATGNIVSTLSDGTSAGRGDAITCMILNPHNPFQLIVGSTDGCIRIWDFLDGILLQVMDVGRPITHIAAHAKVKDEVCVGVIRPGKKVNCNGNPIPTEDNAAVMRVSLKPTKETATFAIQQSSFIATVGKTRTMAGLAFSPSGAWLVAIAGHKAYVARTLNLKAGFTKFVSPERLTCLAFHPADEYFATGDAKGVLRLWYCLNDSIPTKLTGTEKKAPTTTLHWHAHGVSSVTFSANGAYLLSGGEEAVLVIWQLHTGKKEFVPRVGAPIANVVLLTTKQGEEEYFLGLADASFVFVRSGTLKISKTIARIRLDPAVSHDKSPAAVPLAIHSLTSTLVLPSSHPSSLQTYSPTTSRLVSELEVSPSNRVSRRDDKALEPCRVECAVVSDSGEWMATIDAREGDEAHHGEVYLKIWWWDRKAGYWILNTRIDRPHGLQKVTAAVFRPGTSDCSGLQLATSGGDGCIKLWGIRSSKTKGEEIEEYWVTRSSIRFRSEIPSHVAWSLDGSLLAVALGPYVALYDPNTSVLVRTLTCPECKNVSWTQFVGRSSRYLAVAGQRDIVLWDLITQNVRWHHRTTALIQRIIGHPREEAFVSFERTSTSGPDSLSTAVVFGPSSSAPLKICPLPFHVSNVATCPQNWVYAKDPSSFGLVGITSTWKVVLFGDEIHLPEDVGSTPKELAGTAAPVTKKTLFQDVFGHSLLNTTAKDTPVATSSRAHPWKGKEVERIFDAPAYLMPPLGTLFDSLLDNFLLTRSPDSMSDGEDDEQQLNPADEYVRMDVDAEDSILLAENQVERVVHQQEMAAITELFQLHAVRPTSQQMPHLNGTHKTTSKPNGALTHATGTSNTNGAASRPGNPINPTTQAPPSPPPSSSPAVRTGQKRKKSLG